MDENSMETNKCWTHGDGAQNICKCDHFPNERCFPTWNNLSCSEYSALCRSLLLVKFPSLEGFWTQSSSKIGETSITGLNTQITKYFWKYPSEFIFSLVIRKLPSWLSREIQKSNSKMHSLAGLILFVTHPALVFTTVCLLHKQWRLVKARWVWDVCVAFESMVRNLKMVEVREIKPQNLEPSS